MTIEERHLQEKNKLACIYVLVCQVFMIASTFAYRVGRQGIPTEAMVIIQVISICGSIYAYARHRQDEMGRKIFMVTLAASYFAIFAGSIHTPYLYNFVSILILTGMVYTQKRVSIIVGTYCTVTNVILAVLYFTFYDDVPKHKFQVLTSMGFTALMALMSIFLVSLQEKQNRETVEEIEEKARTQARQAENIRTNSESIASKLEDADNAMSSLSDKVSRSSEAVEQIAQSVNMTAEAIQTQTEMNSNITSSLENIAHQTRRMTAFSTDASNAVSDGNVLIKDLQKASDEATKINLETAEMTGNLQESAETVKAIVSTILGISSQTNLLALNASIEAARAGEAGKGFAVVADEIRQLSENTKESAEEIASTIDELIKKVNTASGNMTKSVESSNRQGEMITATGEKFESILEAMAQLTDRVEKIGTAVNECVDANAEVMDAISNLSATSEEIAASSESSIGLTQDCEDDMRSTREILDEILEISRQGV